MILLFAKRTRFGLSIFHWMEMARALLVAIIIASLHSTVGHNWSVLQHGADNAFACNNQTCHGRPHSVCLYPECAHRQNCKDLRLIRVVELSDQDVDMLLKGHNGLRNRVATLSKPPVANMNLVHWDEHLEQMAEGWIKQCTIETDSCEFIREPSITVGQNIRFESAEKMPKRWIVQIIKHWFLDGLIRTRAILEKRPNYTQLVWPEVEFIGCAAAQYVNGYMLACNYHPKANDSLELAFKRGEPCTDCPNNQRGCSRIFPGLCGIDIPLNGGQRTYPNVLMTFVLLSIVRYLNIFV